MDKTQENTDYQPGMEYLKAWINSHSQEYGEIALEVGEADLLEYNTAAKSNRFGTQDKPNKNVIRTWATTQEKSIQRISRPK